MTSFIFADEQAQQFGNVQHKAKKIKPSSLLRCHMKLVQIEKA